MTLLKRLSLICVFYFSVIAVSIFFPACEGDDQLGLDLQPPGDLLNASRTDTISIIAYTKKVDSVRTDETNQSLAGFYSDPVFGAVKASFCSQIRLNGTDVAFGNNPEIDSVVLHLEYYSIYGNNRVNNRMTFGVYELQNDIYTDTTYYSNSLFSTGALLGAKSFIPNMNDSTVVGGRTLAPQLRIRLDNQLGKDFIEAASLGYLADNATFQSWFPGFCIVPSGNINNGSIVSLDVMSANSGLTVYYHNDDDTLSYTFSITQSCARFGKFEHFDHVGANPELISQINGDTTGGQQKLFLQPLSGTQVYLKFPKIQSLNQEFAIVINRAELFIPADQNDASEETYPRPVSLALVKINDDESFAYLPDQASSESTFGGLYDDDLDCYRFTLTRYLQDLLSNPDDDYGLMLLVNGASVRANRVVLNGPDNSYPLRLEVTYTLID